MFQRISVLLFFLAALSLGSRALLEKQAQPGSLMPEKLHLGILVPLSGPLAQYGEAIRNGITLAQQDHPEKLSRLSIVYEDTQYSPSRAVSAFQKLKSRGVDVVYNFGGPTSEAIAPLAERTKTPLLAWSADPLLAQNREYTIRFINPAQDFGIQLSAYLKERNLKRLAIVKTENQYINCMIEGLQSALHPSQEVTILDNYDASAHDFRASIAKLQAGSYDAIGVYLLSGQVAQFYRQMGQLETRLPSFGTDFFESRSEVALAGAMMQGAVFSNHSVVPDFLERYRSEFGNDYQVPNAGLAYDLVTLLSSIARSSGTLTGSKLITAIQQTEAQTGVSGDFHYQESAKGDRYFSFPLQLRSVAQEGTAILAQMHN